MFSGSLGSVFKNYLDHKLWSRWGIQIVYDVMDWEM